MEPLINNRYAPEANHSMWAGIAALLTIFLPFVGALLLLKKLSIPPYVVMIIIPAIALILGGTAIYFAIKAFLVIRVNRSNYNFDSSDYLVGIGSYVFGAISGTIGVLLSFFIISTFVMTIKSPVHGINADRNPIVGDAKIYFFEYDNYDVIIERSILLSDSCLVTTGMLSSNDSARTRSGILLKTDLNGNKLWSKRTPGGLSRIALLNDSMFINCRLEYSQATDYGTSNKLVIDQYNEDGDLLDTNIFEVGNSASIATNATRSILPNGVAIAGIFDQSEDGKSGESYLFRANERLMNQTFTKFRLDVTGEPIALRSNSMGDIYLVGQKVNSIDVKRAIRNRTLILSKISTNGETMWSKTFPPIQAPFIVDMVVSDSGEIYILTNVEHDVYNHGNLMKLDADGELIWTKIVTGDDQNLVTAFAKRPGEWILTGSTRKYVLRTTISQRRDFWWNTYYVCLLDSSGEIEYEFNGGRTQFSAWGITEISENSWVFTGTGKDGKLEALQKVERPNYEVGILHYKYKPSDNETVLNIGK